MEGTIAEDLQHLALQSAQRDEMPDALNEDVVIHFRCGGTSCFLHRVSKQLLICFH